MGIKRSFREELYHGPFHVYMGPEHFVEDDSSVFLCKTGQVGLALEICGSDYSCVDEQELKSIAVRWGDAIRMFTPDFEVRQYAHKTPNPVIPKGEYKHPEVERLVGGRADHLASQGADLYSVELHALILLDCPLSRKAKKKPAVSADNLQLACERLRSAVKSFVQHIKSDVSVRVLDKDATYNFLRRLANFEPELLAPHCCPSNENIDHAICESRLQLIWEDELHRDPYLRIEHTYAKVMALKILPKETDVNMLARLFAVPCGCIFASTWRSEDVDRTLNVANFRMKKFWRKAKQSNSENKNAEVLYDMDNLDSAKELSLLRKDVGQKGERFGHYSLYAVLYGDETRVHASAVEITKAFRVDDGAFLVDHWNQLRGYLATLPGNHEVNRRKQRISLSNYADLSTIFSVDCGSVKNPHLDGEYWTVFESKPSKGLFGRTPYFFNPVHDDGQHFVIVGSPGSGKTTLLKMLAVNGQKYDPFTVFFDKKHSFRDLTRRFGGTYVSFADRNFRINPLMLPESEENIQFLSQFVAVLIEHGGATMTSEDKEDLYRYIRIMYKQPVETRRLSVLQNMLRLELSDALAPWVGNGQYGWVFDHAEDTLTFADWQSFEFEGMDSFSEALEPLLFYILHRIRQKVFDPKQSKRLKLIVLDEAWSFVKNPVIQAYMEQAARTYRDQNACLIFCTQGIGDLPPAFVDCCRYKLILKLNRVDRELYEKVGQLNLEAIKEIESLQRRREFLLATPEGSRVLQCNFSDEELLAYK